MIKLNKVNILGEEDPTYGFKYWAETDTSPVMFSSKTPFNDGDSIAYEESEQRKSKGKGTPYLFLKKVKKLQTELPSFENTTGQDFIANSTQLDDILKYVEEIHDMLSKLTEFDR